MASSILAKMLVFVQINFAFIFLVASNLAFALNASIYAPFDGYGNNLANPSLGSVGSPFLRILPATDTNVPLPYNSSTHSLSRILAPWLPNPLYVSSQLNGSSSLSLPYPSSANVLFFGFFQLLLLDIVHPNILQASVPIPVPTGDPVFDPLGFGNATYPYYALAGTLLSNGNIQYTNNMSSFIDASFLYGINASSAAFMRTGKNGLLKLSLSNLLPLTSQRIPLSNSNALLFGAPDARINQGITTQVLCTIFAREHNRMAQVYSNQNQSLSDDELFYMARKWIIGVWQHIVFDELYPLLIGASMPEYAGYDPTVDPSTSIAVAIFMQQAVRSAYPVEISVCGSAANPSAAPCGYLFSDSVYRVEPLLHNGIEPFLISLFTTPSPGIGTHYTSASRSWLLGGTVPYDAFAQGIMTSRQLGLLPFSEYCKAFAVSYSENFNTLASTPALAKVLSSAYNANYSAVDLFTFGIAPSAKYPIICPPFFASIVADQLARLRNGDRFYYNASTSYYSSDDIETIMEFSAYDLILLNANLTVLPNNIFKYRSKYLSTSHGHNDLSSAQYEKSSSRIVASPEFSFNWTITSSLLFSSRIIIQMELASFNPRGAWYAIGFGGGFENTDVILVTITNNSFLVLDSWIKNGLPVSDVECNPPGEQNLFDISIDQKSKTSAIVTLSRLLKTGDPYDYAIIPGLLTQVSWAFSSQAAFPTYHYGLSGKTNVTFEMSDKSDSMASHYTAHLAAADTGTSIYFYVHGISMIAYTVFGMPISIFAARYMHEYPYWLEIHEKLSICVFFHSIATTVYYIAVPSTQSDTSSYDSAHGGAPGVTAGMHSAFGIAVNFLFICVSVLGVVIRYCTKILDQSPELAKQIRLAHWVIGYLLFGLSQFAAITGVIILFGSSLWVILAYGVFYFVIIASLTRGEYKVYLEFSRPYNTVAKAQYKLDMKAKYSHLPEFTWKDIALRVAKGSLWIIIDNVVYNVATIVAKHPGGSWLLHQALGTDASSLFDASAKDIELINILKRSDTESQNVGQQAQNKAQLASIEEHSDDEEADAGGSGTNNEGGGHVVKYRAPENLHRHSRTAGMAMEHLAVGTLDSCEIGRTCQHISSIINAEMNTNIKNPGIWPYEGKILAITSKKAACSQEAAVRVILLTLAFELPDQTASFYPGDQIALQQVDKKGRLLIKNYTPVRHQNIGSVQLLIKMHKDCKFAQLLAGLSKGDSLVARGPVCASETLFNTSGNLGCYKKLGMVVQGTGIATALLLIDFHRTYMLGEANEGEREESLFLLYVNNTEDDIVYQKELEEIALDNMGALKVRYCVIKPKEEWNNGYTGQVTLDMLRETMPASMGGKRSIGAHSDMTSISQISQENSGSRMTVQSKGLQASKNTLEVGLNEPTSIKKFQLTSNSLSTAGAPTVRVTSDSTSKTRSYSTERTSTHLKIVVCGSKKFNESISNLLTELKYMKQEVELVASHER